MHATTSSLPHVFSCRTVVRSVVCSTEPEALAPHALSMPLQLLASGYVTTMQASLEPLAGHVL